MNTLNEGFSEQEELSMNDESEVRDLHLSHDARLRILGQHAVGCTVLAPLKETEFTD